MATNGRDPIAQMVNEIRAYQEKAELTDQQIAEELGCPRSTWAAMRLGHFVPGRKFLAKVARSPRFKDAAMKALTS